ncbi:hypothetical protein MTO96_050052 [Rhipicephalus appendiculatus]
MEWHDAEEPGTGGKRPRDAASSEPSDSSSQEPPAKAAVYRRQRLSIKPNVLEGEKRAVKPPPDDALGACPLPRGVPDD